VAEQSVSDVTKFGSFENNMYRTITNLLKLVIFSQV